MVAAFKVTAAVFKVPPGATVPVLTLRIPIVPPAPEMVPLVEVETEAAPIWPVTFKVPLITLIAPVTPVVLESPDKVKVPTPSRLSAFEPVPADTTLPAKVLAAVAELRINWVALAKVVVAGKAPMLKAPPETIVPPRLTVVAAVPVMVAPEVSEVISEATDPKVTLPVFKNTGAPAKLVVPAKVTL